MRWAGHVALMGRGEMHAGFWKGKLLVKVRWILYTTLQYTNKHVTDSHIFPQHTAAATCTKLVLITKKKVC
jgi:hypothetical protein